MIKKPRLIACTSILVGLFFFGTGVYLLARGKSGSADNQGASSPYSYQPQNSFIEPNKSNSNRREPSVKKESKPIKQSSLETENTAPVVKEENVQPQVKATPPYPAPDGAKWRQVKNGWILSPVKNRTSSETIVREKTPQPIQDYPRGTGENPAASDKKPCVWQKIGGRMYCVRVQ